MYAAFPKIPPSSMNCNVSESANALHPIRLAIFEGAASMSAAPVDSGPVSGVKSQGVESMADESEVMVADLTAGTMSE
jgi:hypothetical protein